MLHFEAHFPWHALKPNTCNSCFETNLTKVGFSNYGQYFVTIINLSHLHRALAQARLITFWSFYFYTTMASPKMRAFILTWFWYWRPPLEVEGLPSLAFSATKPCTFFNCLINNHLAQYATMQVPTLHLHFDPTFVHSLSFRAILGGQQNGDGWKA